MASGTIYGTTSNQYIDCKITWSSTVNEAANTSTVRATLYYKRNNSGYATSGTGDFSISVDGSEQSASKQVNITSTLWLAVVSGTWTVAHGSNGAKSVTISATGNIPGTTLESTSCSESVTLDKISLSSTADSLTCSTSYVDGALTYKYTPRGAYYTRANIALNNGGYINIRSISHGLGTPGIQKTQTVTFSASELSAIYNALPNTATAKIRVTIRTYSDSQYTVQVGSAGAKEISLTIPVAIKPAASLTVSPVNTNAWINGKGIYVAGYSGLSAALSATAGEGASMSAYSITGGNYSSNSSTLSVNKISDSGTLKVVGTAKDSRGRSATADKTITVQSYSIPAITSLAVDRGTYDSNWTADDNGLDVRVVFRTTLSLTGYDNNYKATFKLDESTASPSSGTTTGLKSETTYAVYFHNIDNEKSHTLKISATDAVGNSGSAAITIATANITIEFNTSGKGIAFGKTSEKDAFECAMDAEFSGELSIVGKAGQLFRIPEIQFGTVKITPSAANTPTSAKVTFPKEFSGVPTVIVSPVGSIVGTTILGAGVTAYTTKDCLLWVTRTNTSETTLNWIAVY